MKLIDLPDFAKPYKKRGYDVRKVGHSYNLYKVTSKRVKDKSYPVLIQEFIGVIDPVNGLIPKKTSDANAIYLEYGLSHLIYRLLHRTLVRSISFVKYGSEESYIKLAIIYYVHGSLCDMAIKKTYIFRDCIDTLIAIRNHMNENRLNILISKINFEMKLRFGDDLPTITTALRLVVVKDDAFDPHPFYEDDVIQLANKHGVKL